MPELSAKWEARGLNPLDFKQLLESLNSGVGQKSSISRIKEHFEEIVGLVKAAGPENTTALIGRGIPAVRDLLGDRFYDFLPALLEIGTKAGEGALRLFQDELPLMRAYLTSPEAMVKEFNNPESPLSQLMSGRYGRDNLGKCLEAWKKILENPESLANMPEPELAAAALVVYQLQYAFGRRDIGLQVRDVFLDENSKWFEEVKKSAEAEGLSPAQKTLIISAVITVGTLAGEDVREEDIAQQCSSLGISETEYPVLRKGLSLIGQSRYTARRGSYWQGFIADEIVDVFMRDKTSRAGLRKLLGKDMGEKIYDHMNNKDATAHSLIKAHQREPVSEEEQKILREMRPALLRAYWDARSTDVETKIKNYEKQGPLTGRQKGGTVQIDGIQYYAKFYDYKNEDRMRTEWLGWMIFMELGIPVADEMFVAKVKVDGIVRPAILSRWLKDSKSGTGTYEDKKLRALEFVGGALIQDEDRGKGNNYVDVRDPKTGGLLRKVAIDFGCSGPFSRFDGIKGEGKDSGNLPFGFESFQDMLKRDGNLRALIQESFYQGLSEKEINRAKVLVAEKLTPETLLTLIEAAGLTSEVQETIAKVYGQSLQYLRDFAAKERVKSEVERPVEKLELETAARSEMRVPAGGSEAEEQANQPGRPMSRAKFIGISSIVVAGFALGLGTFTGCASRKMDPLDEALKGDLNELRKKAEKLKYPSLRNYMLHYIEVVEFLRESEKQIYPNASPEELARRIRFMAAVMLWIPLTENPAFAEKQIGGGPAKGPFQVEKATWNDVINAAKNSPQYSKYKYSKYKYSKYKPLVEPGMNVGPKTVFRLFYGQRFEEPSPGEVAAGFEKSMERLWNIYHEKYNVAFQTETQEYRNDGDEASIHYGLSTREKVTAAAFFADDLVGGDRALADILSDENRRKLESFYAEVSRDYILIQNVSAYDVNTMRVLRKAERVMDKIKAEREKEEHSIVTLQALKKQAKDCLKVLIGLDLEEGDAKQKENEKKKSDKKKEYIDKAQKALSILENHFEKRRGEENAGKQVGFAKGQRKRILEEAKSSVEELEQSRGRLADYFVDGGLFTLGGIPWLDKKIKAIEEEKKEAAKKKAAEAAKKAKTAAKSSAKRSEVRAVADAAGIEEAMNAELAALAVAAAPGGVESIEKRSEMRSSGLLATLLLAGSMLWAVDANGLASATPSPDESFLMGDSRVIANNLGNVPFLNPSSAEAAKPFEFRGEDMAPPAEILPPGPPNVNETDLLNAVAGDLGVDGTRLKIGSKVIEANGSVFYEVKDDHNETTYVFQTFSKKGAEPPLVVKRGDPRFDAMALVKTNAMLADFAKSYSHKTIMGIVEGCMIKEQLTLDATARFINFIAEAAGSRHAANSLKGIPTLFAADITTVEIMDLITRIRKQFPIASQLVLLFVNPDDQETLSHVTLSKEVARASINAIEALLKADRKSYQKIAFVSGFISASGEDIGSAVTAIPAMLEMKFTVKQMTALIKDVRVAAGKDNAADALEAVPALLGKLTPAQTVAFISDIVKVTGAEYASYAFAAVSALLGKGDLTPPQALAFMTDIMSKLENEKAPYAFLAVPALLGPGGLTMPETVRFMNDIITQVGKENAPYAFVTVPALLGKGGLTPEQAGTFMTDVIKIVGKNDAPNAFVAVPALMGKGNLTPKQVETFMTDIIKVTGKDNEYVHYAFDAVKPLLDKKLTPSQITGIITLLGKRSNAALFALRSVPAILGKLTPSQTVDLVTKIMNVDKENTSTTVFALMAVPTMLDRQMTPKEIVDFVTEVKTVAKKEAPSAFRDIRVMISRKEQTLKEDERAEIFKFLKGKYDHAEKTASVPNAPAAKTASFTIAANTPGPGEGAGRPEVREAATPTPGVGEGGGKRSEVRVDVDQDFRTAFVAPGEDPVVAEGKLKSILTELSTIDPEVFEQTLKVALQKAKDHPWGISSEAMSKIQTTQDVIDHVKGFLRSDKARKFFEQLSEKLPLSPAYEKYRPMIRELPALLASDDVLYGEGLRGRLDRIKIENVQTDSVINEYTVRMSDRIFQAWGMSGNIDGKEAMGSVILVPLIEEVFDRYLVPLYFYRVRHLPLTSAMIASSRMFAFAHRQYSLKEIQEIHKVAYSDLWRRAIHGTVLDSFLAHMVINAHALTRRSSPVTSKELSGDLKGRFAVVKVDAFSGIPATPTSGPGEGAVQRSEMRTLVTAADVFIHYKGLNANFQQNNADYFNNFDANGKKREAGGQAQLGKFGVYREARAIYLRYMERLLDMLPPVPAGQQRQLLSIGLGDGTLEKALQEKFSMEVSGYEIASVLAARAREKGIQVSETPAEEGMKEVADNSQDVVLLSESMGYVDPVKVFAEAFRVLKPGGVIVIVQYPVTEENAGTKSPTGYVYYPFENMKSGKSQELEGLKAELGRQGFGSSGTQTVLSKEVSAFQAVSSRKEFMDFHWAQKPLGGEGKDIPLGWRLDGLKGAELKGASVAGKVAMVAGMIVRLGAGALKAVTELVNLMKGASPDEALRLFREQYPNSVLPMGDEKGQVILILKTGAEVRLQLAAAKVMLALNKNLRYTFVQEGVSPADVAAAKGELSVWGASVKMPQLADRFAFMGPKEFSKKSNSKQMVGAVISIAPGSAGIASEALGAKAVFVNEEYTSSEQNVPAAHAGLVSLAKKTSGQYAGSINYQTLLLGIMGFECDVSKRQLKITDLSLQAIAARIAQEFQGLLSIRTAA